jgi:hypothetical protein
MDHYWNGQRISSARAFASLCTVADAQGYEIENWAASWERRGYSEAARDFLCEISNYQLEIVAE